VSTKGNGHDEDLPVVAPPAPEGTEEAAPPEAEAPGEAGLAASEPADELEALRRERDDLKDALLRRRADFENFRRRAERDRAGVATEAEAGVLRQILGTVDNLERALGAAGGESGLREGVELTHREFLSLLDSLGVETIAPLGQRFDPALHQAIVHEPAAGFEAGTVAEVFRKGYTYKGRLLRPALVKVSSGGDVEGAESGGDAQ
jgi:molecular chaperone GrpE